MEHMCHNTFKELIDEVYDEIFIWDHNLKIVYANKACYRHYGLTPEDMIGMTLDECITKERYWAPSCVPYTYKEKVSVIQRQKTLLGIDIDTISIPVLDENNNIKFVVQSVRDSEENLYRVLSPIKVDSNSNDINDNELIYKSRIMKDTIQYCRKIASVQAPVLILGETGTGKSLLAKHIHNIGDRTGKPFIHVNMASVNAALIESEFFGYKKGSFTGANLEGKKGFFEMAAGGTIFLDEVGELPFELQAKFLHVLQENEFIPIGGTSPVKLDVRIICATNCDIQKMIEAGKFREDLYHRVNVFEVTIPPLRKRKEDIKLLAAHFLNIFNQKYGKSLLFSDKALKALLQYQWKGNTRELSNVIERAVLICACKHIEITDFPDSFFSISNKEYQSGNYGDKTYSELMEECEYNIIAAAFKKYKTSRKVADALGVSQSKANRLKLKHLGDRVILD